MAEKTYSYNGKTFTQSQLDEAAKKASPDQREKLNKQFWTSYETWTVNTSPLVWAAKTMPLSQPVTNMIPLSQSAVTTMPAKTTTTTPSAAAKSTTTTAPKEWSYSYTNLLTIGKTWSQSLDESQKATLAAYWIEKWISNAAQKDAAQKIVDDYKKKLWVNSGLDINKYDVTAFNKDDSKWIYIKPELIQKQNSKTTTTSAWTKTTTTPTITPWTWKVTQTWDPFSYDNLINIWKNQPQNLNDSQKAMFAALVLEKNPNNLDRTKTQKIVDDYKKKLWKESWLPIDKFDINAFNKDSKQWIYIKKEVVAPYTPEIENNVSGIMDVFSNPTTTDKLKISKLDELKKQQEENAKKKSSLLQGIEKNKLDWIMSVINEATSNLKTELDNFVAQKEKEKTAYASTKKSWIAWSTRAILARMWKNVSDIWESELISIAGTNATATLDDIKNFAVQMDDKINEQRTATMTKLLELKEKWVLSQSDYEKSVAIAEMDLQDSMTTIQSTFLNSAFTAADTSNAQYKTDELNLVNTLSSTLDSLWLTPDQKSQIFGAFSTNPRAINIPELVRTIMSNKTIQENVKNNAAAAAAAAQFQNQLELYKATKSSNNEEYSQATRENVALSLWRLTGKSILPSQIDSTIIQWLINDSTWQSWWLWVTADNAKIILDAAWIWTNKLTSWSMGFNGAASSASTKTTDVSSNFPWINYKWASSNYSENPKIKEYVNRVSPTFSKYLPDTYKAASSYWIDPAMLIAIMQNDTNLWKRMYSQYNFWNVWNTDSLVAAWKKWVWFSTPYEWISAVANNLKKRIDAYKSVNPWVNPSMYELVTGVTKNWKKFFWVYMTSKSWQQAVQSIYQNLIQTIPNKNTLPTESI